MPSSVTAGPIFIHSLFRSGSTYISSVFRRLEEAFWCYQEPANEFLIHLNDDPQRLLEVADETARHFRHPVQERCYFWEFYSLKEELAGLFRVSFPYDEYFLPQPSNEIGDDFKTYIGALIEHAPQRPVLQFCRSSGRGAGLKSTFGGLHIHLWREPRDQWWSFKVDPCFDASLRRIYGARFLPPVLRDVHTQLGFTVLDPNALEGVDESQNSGDDPVANYGAFYALWLYAYIATERCADLSISIDMVSTGKTHRTRLEKRLREVTGAAVDLSDCISPRTPFAEEDRRFFDGIEERVAGIFVSNGYDRSILEPAIAAHRKLESLEPKRAEVRRASTRGYTTALRLLSGLHDTKARLTAELGALSETNARLSARVEELNARVEGLSSEVGSVSAQLKAVNADLLDAKTYAKDVETRYGEAVRGLDERDAAIRTATARIEELEATLDRKIEEVTRAEQESQAWQAKTLELESRADELGESISRAERESEHWKRVSEDLGQNAVWLEEQVASLERESKHWKDESEDLAKRASLAEKNVTDLEGKLSHWEQVSNELTQRAAVAEEEARHLEEELEQWKRTSEEQTQRAGIAEDRAAHSERESLYWKGSVDGLEDRIGALTAEVAEAKHQAHHWWTVSTDLDQHLKAMHASRSWRLTKPMRAVEEKAIDATAWAMRFAFARPRLHALALSWVRRHPRLKARLRRVAEARRIVPGAKVAGAVGNEGDLLTADARRVFVALKDAREVQGRDPSNAVDC